jgi:hypothetical protein
MERTSHDRRAVLLSLAAGAPLALMACAQAPAKSGKAEAPVQVEVQGSSGAARVVLSEKAAERLGVRTTPVREEQVGRTRTVGGVIVNPVAAPAAAAAAAPRPGVIAVPGVAPVGGDVLVRVRLSEGDHQKVDRSRPAHVSPLENRPIRATGGTGIAVRPVEAPPGDVEGEGMALYYAADGAGHGLTTAQRVLVELPLGAAEARRVVPYSAVLYDLKGEAWVFVSAQPRTFVRQRISVDFIDGERAVLSEGPPAGAAVVSVGAAELYGAETGIGKK